MYFIGTHIEYKDKLEELFNVSNGITCAGQIYYPIPPALYAYIVVKYTPEHFKRYETTTNCIWCNFVLRTSFHFDYVDAYRRIKKLCTPSVAE